MKPDDKRGPNQSPVMGEAERRRQPVFDPTGKVEQINSDEVKICDVRRHPIGLVFVYLQVFFAFILTFGILLILGPDVAETLGFDKTSYNGFVAVLMIIFLVFGAIFTILATRIYKGNQLIITDMNVTQVLQVSLFHRKISELSMSNVEDVTASQRGILPMMFNYGTLHVETAGEQNNFAFKFCPNPNAHAKALQDARANFLRGNSKDNV